MSVGNATRKDQERKFKSGKPWTSGNRGGLARVRKNKDYLYMRIFETGPEGPELEE